MKTFYRSLGFARFVIAALLLSAAARGAGLAVGDPMPAWTLTDLKGKTLSGKDFKGKVVVVDFWATWCGPCVSEIPGYIELQKKYGDQGLVFVGLSIDQAGPKVVKQFVAAKHLNYRVAMADDNIQSAFGASGGFEFIPTTFIFDRSGKVARTKVGAMPEAEFEAIIKPLLK